MRYFLAFSMAGSLAASEDVYEVQDDIAILTAEYTKDRGTQVYITYLTTILMAAVLGTIIVYYATAAKGKVEIPGPTKSDREENNKRIIELTQSYESKLHELSTKLDNSEQRLQEIEREKEIIIQQDQALITKKNQEIQQLRGELNNEKKAKFESRRDADSWQVKCKEAELLKDKAEHELQLCKDTNDQKKPPKSADRDQPGILRRFMKTVGIGGSKTETMCESAADTNNETKTNEQALLNSDPQQIERGHDELQSDTEDSERFRN